MLRFRLFFLFLRDVLQGWVAQPEQPQVLYRYKEGTLQ
jgi:hypothetical protein